MRVRRPQRCSGAAAQQRRTGRPHAPALVCATPSPQPPAVPVDEGGGYVEGAAPVDEGEGEEGMEQALGATRTGAGGTEGVAAHAAAQRLREREVAALGERRGHQPLAHALVLEAVEELGRRETTGRHRGKE
jgi:hypothetical protein